LISQVTELQKKSAGAESRRQDVESARDAAVKAKEDSDSRYQALQIEMEQLHNTYESSRQAITALTQRTQAL
jgi:predicted  nucleic acid-binding Zn-ribbon protein